MPSLTVNLISGKAVDEAGLASFEGNGAELRERVGCALRVTPSRLTLLTTDAQIEDADPIEEGIQCPITAMVGEGDEIADFCRKEMPDFTVKDVEDALALPPGSQELSDGILLGRVMMVAIKKEQVKIVKKYKKTLKAKNQANWYYNSPEYSDEEDVDEEVRPLWRTTRDSLKKTNDAVESFVKLDKRLQGPSKLQFYCRWEDHEHNWGYGGRKRHRVYGIRQAYAAVEFEKVLGRWLELEGEYDQAASQCILKSWYERITTTIEVQRLCTPEHVIKIFHTFCGLLMAARRGDEAAAWILPREKSATAALLKGLSREAFMLRAHAGLATEAEGREDAMKVIEAAVEHMIRIEGLAEELWEFMRDLAEDRCDPLRFLGMRLLTQHQRTRESTQQILQQQAEFDWPHVRDAAQAALEKCRTALPEAESNGPESEGSTDDLSPRSLYLRSMPSNPLTLTIRRGWRRMQRGRRSDDKHVLFIVNEDEEDEDEIEEEE